MLQVESLNYSQSLMNLNYSQWVWTILIALNNWNYCHRIILNHQSYNLTLKSTTTSKTIRISIHKQIRGGGVLTAWVWKGGGMAGVEEDRVVAGVEDSQTEQVGWSVWTSSAWRPMGLEECGRIGEFGQIGGVRPVRGVRPLLWDADAAPVTGGDQGATLLCSEWRWWLAGGQEAVAAGKRRWLGERWRQLARCLVWKVVAGCGWPGACAWIGCANLWRLEVKVTYDGLTEADVS
jgi:hypothetical protein